MADEVMPYDNKAVLREGDLWLMRHGAEHHDLLPPDHLLPGGQKPLNESFSKPPASSAPKRKPSISTLLKRAEKTGRRVTAITTPDGTTLHFGEPAPAKSEEGNELDQWIAKHAGSTKRH